MPSWTETRFQERSEFGYTLDIYDYSMTVSRENNIYSVLIALVLITVGYQLIGM